MSLKIEGTIIQPTASLERPNDLRDTRRRDAVRAIYDADYAASYKALYIDQWMHKHAVNLFLIHRLLPAASSRYGRWLDVGCGPAWHFSKVAAPGVAKVGLDLSWAQLAVARESNADATFVCGDMSAPLFDDASFGLVTSFWSPYSYLESIDHVAAFVQQLARWTVPGGALYLDIMLPQGVFRFGKSSFSRATGFAAEPLAEDGTRWTYTDLGGDHEIVTPDLPAFQNWLAGQFEEIAVEHDRLGFAHLVAMGKRG